MDKAVVAFDFGRMFLGDEPALFLLEIAFRTVVIYLYTLLLIRWVGSRSIAQLSLVEFLLVIALGSAVGDAMFYPEVPLIHCMVVITVVVLLDKLLAFLVSRSAPLEDIIEGKSVEVVRNGVIDCRMLDKSNLGHDELFEQLRLKNIEQLGQVRAAYLETNGMVAVFPFAKGAERAGLSIDPPWDVMQPEEIKAGTAIPASATLACSRCATVRKNVANVPIESCLNCSGEIWHIARVESLTERGPIQI